MIRVEVVFAEPEKQRLIELEVDKGATVADVLAASGIAASFRNADLTGLPVGIWGKVVARDATVRDGDRVELYRPLEMDPREARRLRATGQAPVPGRDESR
ncbi:MAG: RnfH family protein [Woeseiaceae bacterium]|nr:RnfH family protein [Woeseiaceae bacterium]